ncbi:hypothetical protein SY83_17865 [Paenibacillus swuensis]|uniref:Uncharacterized protein n=1 Tax=Paenibacillus swuensis TaxID=1178515 RepID=A0A172TLA4_9BACL|nr:hypothetical protein [Paenibacillus swuensis]ANE47849.1 hypothetical protein SY83_17865 [Paenibacillus swuensis]
MVKSAIRHVANDQRGAISIYLIVITGVLFLFTTLLIDFTRIYVAERQSEHALYASMNSVLSAYDSSLQQYGLYGVSINEEDRVLMAQKIIKLNLPDRTASAFQFTNTSYVDNSIRLQPLHSLANPLAIQHQIQEDMKYKAPIEYTRQLLDKWRGLPDAAMMADQYVTYASEVDKLVKLRDLHLKQAFTKWKSWETDYLRYAATDEERYAQLERAELQLQSSTLNTGNPVEEQKRMLQIQQLKVTISELESNLQSSSQQQHEMNLAITRQIAHELDLALRKDEELSVKLAEATQSLNQPQVTSSTQGNQGLQDSLNTITVMGSDYYTLYKSQMASISSAYSNYHTRTVTGVSTSVDHSAHLLHARSVFQLRKDAEGPRLTAAENEEHKREEAVGQAQQAMNDAKHQMAITGCDWQDVNSYMQLEGPEGYAVSYRNGSPATEPTKLNPLDIPPETSGKNSIGILSRALQGIETIRDTLYTNEYILQNFNYRTIDFDMRKVPKPNVLSDPQSHPLRKQEVEYILYGLPSCHANMAAAYGEMYGIRLAVRTIEAILSPKSAGSALTPWLLFLSALAEGASKASADLKLLTEGKEVELISKMPTIQLSYKDYLRLFLWMNMNTSSQLSRTQAMLQLNTGTDLRRATLYMQGEMKTSMRLWFIPGMISLMKWGNAVDGKVRGNQYEWITRTAHSY